MRQDRLSTGLIATSVKSMIIGGNISNLMQRGSAAQRFLLTLRLSALLVRICSLDFGRELFRSSLFSSKASASCD
jgi:hypothetical protein